MRPTTKTTNLTPARTDLIGRDLEVARLRELFNEGRLVTVVGIGGTGKTRLAREFGSMTVPDFPGGVWMLELANFDGVDEALRELAEMLGLGFTGPATSAAPIIELLRNKPRTLLIFDNLEHLIDDIADPIARIVDRTKEVCVLATSREPIRIGGEQRFKLSPLGHEAAVKLFARRAAEVIPSFQLDETNRPAIEQLVDQLDRLPLAIELAAARINVLPPEKLVNRLSERMGALRARDRDRPARHETLAATIEWSWELLDEAQQRGLTRCAVFRGGFSLEALEAVVRYEGLAEDLVEDLIERSLVEFEDTVAGRRFFLFELVRRAAEMKLAASGEQDSLFERHADYYVELVRGTRPEQIYERQADLANLLVALRRTSGPRKAEVALAAAAVLRLSGGVPLLEETLSDLVMETTDEAILARLLFFRAVAVYERDEFENTLADAERAVELAQAHGDIDTESDALSIWAFALLTLGRFDDALTKFTAALERAQKAGNFRLETIALGSLAVAYTEHGDFNRAETLFEQALARCRSAGDDVLTGRSLLNLARCQTYQNRWPEALANVRDALLYLDKVEDDRKRGVAYLTQGLIQAKLDDVEAARASYEMARDIAHALGWREGETSALVGLGELGQDASHRTYLVKAVQLNEGAQTFAEEAIPRSHLAIHDLVGQRHELARPQLRRTIGVIADRDVRWTSMLWGYLACSYAMTHDADSARDSLAAMNVDWAKREDDGSDAAVTPLPQLLVRACDQFLAGSSAEHPRIAALREELEALIAARALAHRSANWASHEPLVVLLRLLDMTFGAASASTFAVSEDGRRFVPPGGEEVDFSRRGPLRKIIVALATAREERPGMGLSADDVLEAGWPGDIVTADAGAARVYSAIRTLRTNGLEEILLTQDDGYLIDPDVTIAWLE